MARRRNDYGTNPDTGKPFRAQWEVILHYLREKPGRTITQGSAWIEFGFSRLSALVYTIRKRTGIDLHRRRIEVPTRYNGRVSVTQYFIG